MFQSCGMVNIVQLISHTNLLPILLMLAIGNTTSDTYIRNNWSYRYSQTFDDVNTCFSIHDLRPLYSLFRNLCLHTWIIFDT